MKIGPRGLFVATAALLIPAMTWIPTWIDPPADVVSVAAAHGYSNAAAFIVALAWVAGVAVIGLLLESSGESGPLEAPAYEHDPRHSATLVLLVVTVIYFPWFLAKMGPYIEDGVFLTATHRMLAGMEPYRDFEFLYGPLMLYPAHWFMSVFGYSMASLYAYMALGELLLMGVLLAVLRSLIPRRGRRWVAFLVMALALSTALFGPNQSGLRRLPALVALVVLASGPLSTRIAALAAALTGVQLAYSHDVGIAALGAAGLLYGVLLLGRHRKAALAFGASFALIAIAVWIGIAAALLRDVFPSYVAELRYLSARFAAGEAAFEFRWTVNSLALFGLLGLSTMAAAHTIRRGPTELGEDAAAEARLLLLGVGFAVLGLRSGLNRADLWHLLPPFQLLLLAWWLPGAARGFGLGRRARAWGLGLTVAAVVTYGVGLLPSVSWLAQGWVAGARATLTRDFLLASRPETAAPAIEFERIRPDSANVSLARFFAEPERLGAPVLFYSTAWALGKQIGVVKADFLNDDFLYSDERGQLALRFLEENPAAYVIMRGVAWDRLNGRGDPRAVERTDQPSITKEIAQRVSSPHFDQMVEEARLREGRWDRIVGRALVEGHEVVARFGEMVVLAARTSDQAGSAHGSAERRSPGDSPSDLRR